MNSDNLFKNIKITFVDVHTIDENDKTWYMYRTWYKNFFTGTDSTEKLFSTFLMDFEYMSGLKYSCFANAVNSNPWDWPLCYYHAFIWS